MSHSDVATSTPKCQSDLINNYSASLYPPERVEHLLRGKQAQRGVKQCTKRPQANRQPRKQTHPTGLLGTPWFGREVLARLTPCPGH